MGQYIYDGTFYGLMTTIARILERTDRPTRIQPVHDNTADIFATPTRIETVEFVAEELLFQIRNDISELAYDHVVYTFLSEHQNSEMIIYHYILKGFEMGNKVDFLLTDEWVRQAHALTRKVEREVHRFKGFVRFRQLADGTYYSTIEPDYNILPLIMPHFVRRLADQNWIIHDLKRNKAAIYNQKSVCLSDISLYKDLVFSQGDEEHKKLWQTYYQTIGIKERENPKLRQQFMPKKYQKHLVELDPDTTTQKPRNDRRSEDQ